MSGAPTMNDADVAHCWNRMRQGYSLAQVAAGRDLHPHEMDLLIWDWRARKTASKPDVQPSRPWSGHTPGFEDRWLRDGSRRFPFAALD